MVNACPTKRHHLFSFTFFLVVGKKHCSGRHLKSCYYHRHKNLPSPKVAWWENSTSHCPWSTDYHIFSSFRSQVIASNCPPVLWSWLLMRIRSAKFIHKKRNLSLWVIASPKIHSMGNEGIQLKRQKLYNFNPIQMENANFWEQFIYIHTFYIAEEHYSHFLNDDITAFSILIQEWLDRSVDVISHMTSFRVRTMILGKQKSWKNPSWKDMPDIICEGKRHTCQFGSNSLTTKVFLLTCMFSPI